MFLLIVILDIILTTSNKWDTDFIDRVHQFDEESIRNGTIKPTHMLAVMKKIPTNNPEYSRGFSPSYCVRDPYLPYTFVDNLTDAKSQVIVDDNKMNKDEDLISWFGSGEDVWFNHIDTNEFMITSHPRTLFVKSLNRHSALLDMGAGDGTLEVFRLWPRPERTDLKFYAYAMDFGKHFDSYDAFELGEWPEKKPDFNGINFDAILSAHFIEHIDKPYDFLEWAVSRLNPNGRLYLEWPSEVFYLQSALWLHTKWVQFVIASKP